MADSGKKAIHCGPCEYENVTKLALKWCSDCEEGYCDDCLRPHKASKMSRHHHLVSVSEYQKVDELAIPQICQVHQKVFEYFCPGHDYVICILCVKSDHNKCPDPLSLQNAAKGTKTSTALSDLELSIDNLLENIKDGIKIQDKNLSNLSDSEQSINIAVKAKHEEMIKYFERLQEKTYIELKSKYGRCQQGMSSSKNIFIKKQTQLQNMKDRIHQMKTCLSDVQAFVGIKIMTENINCEKEVVKSLVTDMSSLVLKFEPNLKLQTSTETIHTYGTTTVASLNSCATFVEPKVEQAQLKIKSVEGIQLQLRTRIDLNCTPCEITSCLILPNKQIVILDKTKKCLMIYNVNGSHDRNIPISYEPFDATIIDRHTVAVTFAFGNKTISIVDMNSNRTKRKFTNSVKKWCWGISHNNRKLFVLSFGEGINVLDLSGCIIKNIPLNIASDVYRLICTSTNIIYTHQHGDEGSLCCLDIDGNPLWNFSDSKIKHSFSSSNLTSDEKGNVYVVGDQSDVLITVSKDGKTERVLLNKQDGLKNPNAVHYFTCGELRLLLVCNRENGHAALYDVRL